jgi:hypothetical protein
MADHMLRFQLSADRSGNAYRLSESNPSADAFVDLKVDLADRKDVDRAAPGGGVLDTAVDTWNGLEFTSDPLPKPTELSGLFSGSLDFVCNKRTSISRLICTSRLPRASTFSSPLTGRAPATSGIAATAIY